MEKDVQLWNQYQNLREEIRGADSLNYQIMALVAGAVAALLAAAAKEEDPLVRVFIFLCIFAVTIPGYRLLQGNRLRIWRISTYLRAFIEPELEFVQWETRLDLQRALKGQTKKRRLSTFASVNEWAIITLTNTVAVLGAIFNLLGRVEAPPAVRVGGSALLCTAHLSIVLWTSLQEKTLRRRGEVEVDFFESWSEVKETERKPPSAAPRSSPSTPGGASVEAKRTPPPPRG